MFAKLEEEKMEAIGQGVILDASRIQGSLLTKINDIVSDDDEDEGAAAGDNQN